ncbi:MAG: spondin domain-containing protein, partial [Planctomycetota bacterium]
MHDSRLSALTLLLALPAFSTPAAADSRPTVVITVENLAPQAGTFQTPLWFGLHDGSFDLYDEGVPASALPVAGSSALERIAEDGSPGPLSDDFAMLAPDGAQGVILSNGPIPPFAPGQVASRLVDVDPAVHRYLSYASMVIPSNDAFVANGDPTAHEIFAEDGSFVGMSFVVPGADVNDAGTEVNDELPENTAFFGQMMPDTGVPEDAPVMPHPGFLLPGNGGILDDPMFAKADFLAPGYQVLRVSLTYFDAAANQAFRAVMDADQQVDDVESEAVGRADLKLRGGGTRLEIRVRARGISSEVVAAHLHLGPVGQNGPVVADLSGGIANKPNGRVRIKYVIEAEDVIGPLAGGDDPLGALLAE